MADVDVNVIHVAVGHDASHSVVGDQPADDLGLTPWNPEVDRLPGRVLRGVVGPGDLGAGPAGRDDLDVAELSADAR